MKRLVLLLLVIILIPAESCRKIRDLANININIPYSTQVTIPAVYEDGVPIPFGGVNASIGPVAIATNSKQYIQEYNTSPDKILHVKLKQLSLKLLSPEGETLDFFDTVRVYISAEGQPEFLAAYYFGRPNGQDSIAMVCSDMNLKSYFLADVMYFKLNARFNRVPEPGTTLGIYSVFNMLANPLY